MQSWQQRQPGQPPPPLLQRLWHRPLQTFAAAAVLPTQLAAVPAIRPVQSLHATLAASSTSSMAHRPAGLVHPPRQHRLQCQPTSRVCQQRTQSSSGFWTLEAACRTCQLLRQPGLIHTRCRLCSSGRKPRRVLPFRTARVHPPAVRCSSSTSMQPPLRAMPLTGPARIAGGQVRQAVQQRRMPAMPAASAVMRPALWDACRCPGSCRMITAAASQHLPCTRPRLLTGGVPRSRRRHRQT